MKTKEFLVIGTWETSGMDRNREERERNGERESEERMKERKRE